MPWLRHKYKARGNEAAERVQTVVQMRTDVGGGSGRLHVSGTLSHNSLTHLVREKYIRLALVLTYMSSYIKLERAPQSLPYKLNVIYNETISRFPAPTIVILTNIKMGWCQSRKYNHAVLLY